jgi:NADH dehydrogenase
MRIHQTDLPRVVIIGGGFGGLEAAKALRNLPVRVTLLDRQNHHLFQPLLYQVATAALSPADIAEPLRAILKRQENTEVLLSNVERIDPAKREVITADGAVGYDYLIVAAGARHSYFGKDEWEKFAPGLKSLDDALELRRRMLLAFEIAEKTKDEAVRKAAMTFVIVGAGPTGVEMAGSISETARATMVSDFRHIDSKQTRVILLDAAPRVLPTFAPDLSESAKRQLGQIGVEVQLNRMVAELDETGVTLKDGSPDGGVGSGQCGFAPRREPRGAAGSRGPGDREGRPEHSGAPRGVRDRRSGALSVAERFGAARSFAGGDAAGPACGAEYQGADRGRLDEEV